MRSNAGFGSAGLSPFTFRTADILNGNRRIYPADVFGQAIEVFKERVGRNCVFGNLDQELPTVAFRLCVLGLYIPIPVPAEKIFG